MRDKEYYINELKDWLIIARLAKTASLRAYAMEQVKELKEIGANLPIMGRQTGSKINQLPKKL